MKALSTILSTVILVVIVITLYALLSTFSTTLFKEQGAQVSIRTDEAIKCSFSNIIIRDVYIDRIGKAVRVNVQNMGQTDEYIANLVLYNNNGEQIYAEGLPVLIARSNLINIEINTTGFIETCGDYGRVALTTSCADVEYNKQPVC